MLKLDDFINRIQGSNNSLIENGLLVIGGQNDPVYTETNEPTVNCDNYSELDGDHPECYRVDQNCCDT